MILFVVAIPAWLVALVLAVLWVCTYNLFVRPIALAWTAPPVGSPRCSVYELAEEAGGASNDCGLTTRAA